MYRDQNQDPLWDIPANLCPDRGVISLSEAFRYPFLLLGTVYKLGYKHLPGTEFEIDRASFFFFFSPRQIPLYFLLFSRFLSHDIHCDVLSYFTKISQIFAVDLMK